MLEKKVGVFFLSLFFLYSQSVHAVFEKETYYLQRQFEVLKDLDFKFFFDNLGQRWSCKFYDQETGQINQMKIRFVAGTAFKSIKAKMTWLNKGEEEEKSYRNFDFDLSIVEDESLTFEFKYGGDEMVVRLMSNDDEIWSFGSCEYDDQNYLNLNYLFIK